MLTDEQIFDILDGCADAEVLQQHTYLLANSGIYQQYFKELESIHLDLAQMPLEHTSVSFTENVLAATPVAKPKAISVKKKVWSSKLPYIFFGIMVAILMVSFIIAIFYQPTSATVQQEPNIMVKELSDLFSKYFTQVGILLNLIVMLALFDKKILRPYFKQRRITLG